MHHLRLFGNTVCDELITKITYIIYNYDHIDIFKHTNIIIYV